MRDGHNLENVLNDLPKCWKVAPLGLTSWVRARLGWKGLKAEEYVEEGIAFLSTPDIKNREINYQKVNRITHERYSESSEIALRVGDVLLTKDGSTIGVVHLVRTLPEPTTVNGSIAVITPSERWESLFLGYVLESSWAQALMSRLQDGMGVPHLFQRDIKRLRLPLPPLETQQRIADYLDRETAEIDAAVADLDKYVELLEKRKRAVGAALLDEAVKDESTLTVHLGSLGTFLSGSGFPHEYQGIEDEEYPFYKVGSLSTADRNAVVHDSRNTVSRKTALELGAKVIPNGSVLMAKIGEAMRLCRFAVNATDCCIDNNMMAVVPRFEHITTDYLRLALTLVTVDVLVNPGPVPSLNVQGLRMFSIPLPSLEIQEKLTDEWKKETSEIDSLIADSTRLRDLLLKRRSVLITEVVTGRKQV